MENPLIDNNRKSPVSQLQRALELQLKVAKTGFDWPSWHGALGKVYEEVDEVKAELETLYQDDNKINEELGDLLFAVINVVRHQKSNPDLLLKAATDKFEVRYNHVEHYVKTLGLTMEQASDEQMEAGWQYAKQQRK